MHPDLKPLADRFVSYLAQRWEVPVTLKTIEQIPGGASRETYRVRVETAGEVQGLILRRDPVSSLIDTERALEYQTYVAVYGTEVPVPEPLILEEDTRHLQRPFSVMREIPGCETGIPLLSTPPYDALRGTIARNKWTLLGKLAAMDVTHLGVPGFMDVPEHPAARELDYWSRVIDADALHPQPVAQATIRWLRRNLPPPGAKLSLVHGDYRSGNFLYATDGAIRGVLDWEMAHIGDPLEDLAWSLDPVWAWPERELAGALLPRDQAIEIWEQASGMPVDRKVFRWWQIFASLKALAIWISSTEDFINGESKEPILGMAGWVLTDRQNRILVDRLQPGSPLLYAEAIV
jgi:aminoglycoside phosphotransferase (APT) family kinase protein